MQNYRNFTEEERKKEISILSRELDKLKDEHLSLNMARGKPSPAQLDYVDSCFAALDYSVHTSADGTDCRNYGELYGLRELREIFAELLKCDPERVWCLGSSSLTIMYDLMTRCLLFPLPGAEEGWLKQGKVRFLCPVPGYDRHFNICEVLGIEMIPIELKEDGPDMDKVEELCASDPLIKGIWLVPMYSNPDGTSYSEEVLRRLFRMKAAEDFRIFADMAYCAHHLREADEERAPLYPLLELAKEEGHEDRVFIFASTSKITYAGGGTACAAMSEKNQAWLKPSLSAQMISANKMNMLRHVQLFRRAGGIDNMMKEHRRILRRKFELAQEVLDACLGPYEIASWTKPLGGYFITAKVWPGTAKAVVRRCRELGITLTPAGSVFPYGKDPKDEYIRLAPSYPETDELKKALEVFSLVCRAEALKAMQ